MYVYMFFKILGASSREKKRMIWFLRTISCGCVTKWAHDIWLYHSQVINPDSCTFNISNLFLSSTQLSTRPDTANPHHLSYWWDFQSRMMPKSKEWYASTIPLNERKQMQIHQPRNLWYISISTNHTCIIQRTIVNKYIYICIHI